MSDDHNAGVALHARCHIKAPPWAWLQPGGTLVFRCSVCRRHVATLELKDPPAATCEHPEHSEGRDDG